MAKTAELYPTLKIALSDQKPSGYIREDTYGTKNQIEKTCPGTFFIPNQGQSIRYVKYGEDGKRRIIPRQEAIKAIIGKEAGYEEIIAEPYDVRYIKGCPQIDKEWQKIHNYEPSVDPHSDSIMIEDGYAEFEYANDPVKYQYITELMWFADLPHRLPNRKPMYYRIKEDKKSMIDIDLALARHAAMDEWKLLVTKAKDGGTLFNEERINGYASLLNVQGLTVVERLNNLYIKLNADPIGFIEKVTAYKEEVITDISHAMQLDLLKFEGNAAVMTYNNKRVALGSTGGSKNTKIERLGELLKTSEYKETYELLKTKIQDAKEKQLN